MIKRIALFISLAVCIVITGVYIHFEDIDDRLKENVYTIEIDVKMINETVQKILESRWNNIVLNIQFAPDNTAIIHAELERKQLTEMLQIPEWIVFVLPDSLYIDLQTRIELDEGNQIVLQLVTMSINAIDMPEKIGEAFCCGLAYKINEIVRAEGVELRSVRIEGEMIKIETEKSSGR